MALSTLTLAGCGPQTSALTQAGTSILGSVLGGQTGVVASAGQTVGNILQSVLGGSQKPTLQQLLGAWKYSQPGCAFTSEQLLAQAGGEVVAAQVKSRLQPTFQSLGINSANTSVTFNQDGTFALSFAGTRLSGRYTYEEQTQKIAMQATLFTINCYAKRNIDGISLLFESSKLLTLLRTVSALSGNATLQTVGEIAGSYDGLRVGFEFKH